jgi:hypothetical protein
MATVLAGTRTKQKRVGWNLFKLEIQGTNSSTQSVLFGAWVTRLGEYLPIWQLFSFGNFFKITEVALIFGQLYSMENAIC